MLKLSSQAKCRRGQYIHVIWVAIWWDAWHEICQAGQVISPEAVCRGRWWYELLEPDKSHVTQSQNMTIWYHPLISWYHSLILGIDWHGNEIWTRIKKHKQTNKDNRWNLNTKMQLDVDIEPTFRFSYMKCIDKQKDITMKQLSLIWYKNLEFFAQILKS